MGFGCGLTWKWERPHLSQVGRMALQGGFQLHRSNQHHKPGVGRASSVRSIGGRSLAPQNCAQDIISANWVVPNRSARLGDDIQTSRFIILLRYAEGKHWKALIVKNLFDLQNLSDGYVKVMQWMTNFLNIVRGSKDKIAFRCVDLFPWVMI